MPRKSAPRRARPQARSNNQDLIRGYIERDNIIGENANALILDLLTNQHSNLDCIIDDAERAAKASSMGWEEQSEEDRVSYIQEQMQTASPARQEKWAEMINGGKLIDQRAYHKLRKQVLQEQIRQVRNKIEKEHAEADRRSDIIASSGGTEPTDWRVVESAPIKRFHTHSPELDQMFGTSYDMFDPADRSKIPFHSGIARNFVYGLGADPGLGKTTFMVEILKHLCGPEKTRDDGVTYGGNKALYIQAECSQGMFAELFLKKVWKTSEVDCCLASANSLHQIEEALRKSQANILVIDSRDIIYELNGPKSRVEDGLRRLDGICEELGVTSFIIAHNNQKGEIKGDRTFSYIVHAVMIGERDEETDGGFTISFPKKNRGGKTGPRIHCRHISTGGIEIITNKSIEKDDSTEQTKIQASYTVGESGSLAAALLNSSALSEARNAGAQEEREED